MLIKYTKSDGTPFIRKLMLDMKKMKAELNEHRYYLERNVERRAAHLLTRIALLESCNSALCSKLALAHEKLAALQSAPPMQDTLPNDRGVKLYIMNNQTRIGSSVQDEWGEHATAA